MAAAKTDIVLPYIQVSFRGMPRDPALEAAIHRWVARLEWMNVGVQRAEVSVERIGRRRTSVSLQIGANDGSAPSATASHADAYVAVSDAFHGVQRKLVRSPVHARRASLALAG
jgi:ribosome-associated translation inhibitor RaiA